jgi:hypothetical protein
MITVKDVEQEMAALRKEVGNATPSTAQASKLAFLKHVKLYLETEPTQAQVLAQLESVRHRLATNAERFTQWCAQRHGGYDELKTQYATQCGTAQLKAQAKTLTYILGGKC